MVLNSAMRHIKDMLYGAKICCLRCGRSLSNCMLASETRGIDVENKSNIESYELNLTDIYFESNT